MSNMPGVRAKASVADWEEAVRVAGAVLEADGHVTPDYSEAMVAARDEFGPYMVIAPGVAMPHARPEAGVRAPGVAIVTLTQPVVFGHETNDPVDVVIAFAALDKNEHLARLGWIARLVGDATTLAAIRSANTTEALAEVLANTQEEQSS